MKKIIHNCAYFVVLLLLPSIALSDQRKVTYDSVLALALGESAIVKEIEAKIASNQALGIEIKNLSNPILDGETLVPLTDKDSQESNEFTLSLTQPLRVSDFGVRRSLNNLIQEASSLDKKIELLELSQSVKLAYLKVWALDKRIVHLQQLQQRLKKLDRLLSEGSKNGLFGIGEAKIFKAEKLKLENEELGLKSDAQRARADLSRLVGAPLVHALEPLQLKVPPVVDQADDINSEIPLLQRSKLTYKIADQQARLASLDASPKFAPRIVYQRSNERVDYLGVGVSLELPTFNRNQSEEIKRTAEKNAAQKALQYFDGEGFRFEIDNRRKALQGIIMKTLSYETEIVPLLREALTAQEDLLRSGQGSIFQVWQLIREINSAESDLIEQLVSAHTQSAEYIILMGKEF